jgi:uncharacterized membrane protein
MVFGIREMVDDMNHFKPEKIILFIILIFGFLNLLITPLGAGFDEDTHVARIWEMSKGALLPNQYLSQGPFFPEVFYQLSYRQQKNLTPITMNQWNDQLKARIDWNNMIYHTTRATYFPLMYLPQAFIMGLLNRLLDIPVAITYYLLRFSYLLIYAILVYLAVRVIPIGKWVLGILAIAPMAIIQATTVQPESINNGVCFLFIGWLLFIARDKEKILSAREVWITCTLSLSIGFIKVNSLPVLLLLFIIPAKKFGSQIKKLLFNSVIFFVVLIFLIGWNFIVYTDKNSFSQSVVNTPTSQFISIFKTPLLFIQSIISNLISQASNYFIGWVGISGYSYWRLPGFVYFLYPLLLLSAVISEKSDDFFISHRRIGLLSVFFLMSLATILVFYLTSFSNNSFTGMQGRYFTASAPLLFLALIPKTEMIKIKKAVLVIAPIFIQISFIFSFFLAYHVTCGSSYFNLDLCYQPLYKNWSPQTSLNKTLSQNSSIQQTFTASCENLTQLRFWINQKASGPQNMLRITLTDLQTNKLVMNQFIEDPKIPSSGWLLTDFLPVKGSKNIPYAIDISPETLHSNGGIDFAFSKVDEYPGGTLSFEGKKMEGDLLFQFGCLTGLAKLVN